MGKKVTVLYLSIAMLAGQIVPNIFSGLWPEVQLQNLQILQSMQNPLSLKLDNCLMCQIS